MHNLHLVRDMQKLTCVAHQEDAIATATLRVIIAYEALEGLVFFSLGDRAGKCPLMKRGPPLIATKGNLQLLHIHRVTPP